MSSFGEGMLGLSATMGRWRHHGCAVPAAKVEADAATRQQLGREPRFTDRTQCSDGGCVRVADVATNMEPGIVEAWFARPHPVIAQSAPRSVQAVVASAEHTSRRLAGGQRKDPCSGVRTSYRELNSDFGAFIMSNAQSAPNVSGQSLKYVHTEARRG